MRKPIPSFSLDDRTRAVCPQVIRLSYMDNQYAFLFGVFDTIGPTVAWNWFIAFPPLRRWRFRLKSLTVLLPHAYPVALSRPVAGHLRRLRFSFLVSTVPRAVLSILHVVFRFPCHLLDDFLRELSSPIFFFSAPNVYQVRSRLVPPFLHRHPVARIVKFCSHSPAGLQFRNSFTCRRSFIPKYPLPDRTADCINLECDFCGRR